MQFFERFRAEVARYAEGVHVLGAPCKKGELARVPEGELRDFYASYDGAVLFVGAVELFPASQLTSEGDRTRIGGTAEGDELWLDGAGRVLRVEEGSGETTVEGSSFAAWLEGWVTGEGVIYDREGEFRDDVFAEDGEGLAPAAEIKRAKKVLKLDPGAPGPRRRLARALEEEGDVDGARAQLSALVKAHPDEDWAWFDLGRLAAGAAELAEAERAFARAAEIRGEHAAFFAAHAARAAQERGDEAARARHAALALELDDHVVRGQLRAAQERTDDGELDEARELAALAKAVAPKDLQVIELLRRLK